MISLRLERGKNYGWKQDYLIVRLRVDDLNIDNYVIWSNFMGMRERYDENGNIKGYHNMIFDNIPDNYQIQKVILEDKVYDLSYIGVMKYLRTIKVAQEFDDDIYYSSEILSNMALDYLNSARFLYQGIAEDRGRDVVTYYFIPCAFLCKHSIELKLKECLVMKGLHELKGHSVLGIWNDLNEEQIPHGGELRQFLSEVEKIDNNEMALRYGISKRLTPLQENFKFDIDNLLTNTMFLFNVVDEYIICRYRYGKDT